MRMCRIRSGAAWGVFCLLCFVMPVFPAWGASSARLLLSCEGMKKPLGLADLQRKARDKNPDALYCLGQHYDQGTVLAADLRLAAQWMRSAADAGHAEAMNRYGEMLLEGRGVSPSVQRAAIWFLKAAEQGHTGAQARMGLLYEQGQGVEKDLEEAGAWYARAALKKHPRALARLGLMFVQGRGVERHVGRASLLLYEAALLGDQEALSALREMGNDTPGAQERTRLLGLYPDKTDRHSVREALRRPGVTVLREDSRYYCDAYDVEQSMPGAGRLTACYGRDSDGAPGLIRIDYPTANPADAEDVRNIWEEQFGAPAAREGKHALLWNFGTVVVAAQYDPAQRETILMYIVPEVYRTFPVVPTSEELNAASPGAAAE